MTFKIHTDDIKKIIHCSNIHSACDPSSWNLWMDPINPEPPQVIKSFHSTPPSPPHGEDFMAFMSDDAIGDAHNDAGSMNDNNLHCMSVICANDLVSQILLINPREDGQWHHACILEFIQDHEYDLKMSDDHHKFRISVNDDEYEEIIMYSELMNFIEKNEENEDIVWKFKHIIGHQGALICTDPNYKGSM